MTETTGTQFIERSRHFLRDDFLPRIVTCLDKLGDEDLWWRPNEASNSIGNLVLHLAGNARQWIVAGVGGAPDVRKRQQEFDRRDPMPGAELKAHLRNAIEDVDATLARVTETQLLDPRLIQGYDTTVLGAIYHVVEHFSMHTGQILLLTKARTGADLGLYTVRDGIARPNWPRVL